MCIAQVYIKNPAPILKRNVTPTPPRTPVPLSVDPKYIPARPRMHKKAAMADYLETVPPEVFKNILINALKVGKEGYEFGPLHNVLQVNKTIKERATQAFNADRELCKAAVKNNSTAFRQVCGFEGMPKGSVLELCKGRVEAACREGQTTTEGLARLLRKKEMSRENVFAKFSPGNLAIMLIDDLFENEGETLTTKLDNFRYIVQTVLGRKGVGLTPNATEPQIQEFLKNSFERLDEYEDHDHIMYWPINNKVKRIFGIFRLKLLN